MSHSSLAAEERAEEEQTVEAGVYTSDELQNDNKEDLDVGPAASDENDVAQQAERERQSVRMALRQSQEIRSPTRKNSKAKFRQM
jgi:hypothetical protein